MGRPALERLLRGSNQTKSGQKESLRPAVSTYRFDAMAQSLCPTCCLALMALAPLNGFPGEPLKGVVVFF